MTKRKWTKPAVCPVCGGTLKFQYPKDNEWTSRFKCLNNCYDLIQDQGLITIIIKPEYQKPISVEWNDRTTNKGFETAQMRVNAAIKKAKEVWDNLTEKAKHETQYQDSY